MEAPKTPSCLAEVIVRVVGGRWKLWILKELFEGTLRFGELQRKIPKVSQKMLAQQLRELEADHIVCRKVYPEVPPKVEYSLTELGSSLLPILSVMDGWGEMFMDSKYEAQKQKAEVRGAAHLQ